MRAGEFAFTMSGADCTADVAGGTTKEEADAKLAASDRRFTNAAAGEGTADIMSVMETFLSVRQMQEKRMRML